MYVIQGMHTFTHEQCDLYYIDTWIIKAVPIVTREGKRAWRRTGVSKGVLRACLSLSSCQRVPRACHGESGSDQSVCKNYPPRLPAFNGLQQKMKHIDYTLIRKHGACKGNMWDTLASPWRKWHPLLKLSHWIQKIMIKLYKHVYWTLKWFSAASFPGINSGCDSHCKNVPRFDENIAKGNTLHLQLILHQTEM